MRGATSMGVRPDRAIEAIAAARQVGLHRHGIGGGALALQPDDGAWCRDRLLCGRAAKGSQQHLREDLGLALTAHRRQYVTRRPALERHHRHERVQRPFAWRNDIGRLVIQREAGATIVKEDAGFGIDQSRSERVVHALDERNRVAVGVGGGHTDGVPVRHHGRSGRGDAEVRHHVKAVVDQRLGVDVDEAGSATCAARRAFPR